MHRRDFLHPRHLASGTGTVLGALDELKNLTSENEPTTTPEVILLRLRRRAMATNFELILPYGLEDATHAGEDVFDRIDELEDLLTVYRDSSPVSYVNLHASHVPVRIDVELMDLLHLSARIHEQTQGAFDVSAGALIKAWGFFKGPPRIPSASERESVLEQVGMKHVQIEPEKRTVRFLRKGLELNFGSVGKGYALDSAGRLLKEKWDIPCCVLQGGHSSILTLGCQPGEPRGWPVGIRHPVQTDQYLGTVWLKDRALGTSAATHRHLSYNGRRLGHVLDPRTGWPAESMGSATVLAPTAAEADALATAFFIMGVDRAKEFCNSHPEISAILLPAGEKVIPTVLNLNPREIDWTERPE